MKTLYGERGKPEHLHVQVDGEGVEYCGESHCRGRCGLPALFLRYGGKEFKAHSNMVAVGAVWQQKEWDGPRVYVPETENAEELIKAMWW